MCARDKGRTRGSEEGDGGERECELEREIVKIGEGCGLGGETDKKRERERS